MAALDDEIRRQSARPLKGHENQVARYMMELFIIRGRFWPIVWKWAGYLGTGIGVAGGILLFLERLGGK